MAEGWPLGFLFHIKRVITPICLLFATQQIWPPRLNRLKTRNRPPHLLSLHKSTPTGAFLALDYFSLSLANERSERTNWARLSLRDTLWLHAAPTKRRRHAAERQRAPIGGTRGFEDGSRDAHRSRLPSFSVLVPTKQILPIDSRVSGTVLKWFILFKRL